jgi:hypothetical protein
MKAFLVTADELADSNEKKLVTYRMWVTVCCYCEITTTVNTLTSVFFSSICTGYCYIQLSVSDIFTSVSPLILWQLRAALVRSGKRYSHEETDSLKQCTESELCTVSAGCAEQAARWRVWDSSVVPSSVCW